ncbi:ArsR/SmtB family transcription factor [Cupriavidus pauculus]|jgi:DNA-binding transcriptional ArsR family regulator|uniref:ArsR/SmtB family transcription factor n=1 Tax=Cupriavidus pauculus TaxID=82633 RepID=UPI000780FBD4|nr:helix-turn-helix transcriptional regulator [Cupriavidus pauculus]KAB0601680.1 helix-turn-helix transcriptional regulator [Cupriavidus pauculus]MBY4730930.1 ArsR family transcriptional regulator [Cupriavidus pauculus]MCM3607440.1 ArsR family transcriptional regulator [Cupriavidus pauculus]UAL02087.1 ArsR family transcriptional regulator [Cupriavidus pauculus]
MANYQAQISEVFQALADPTRCAIVAALVGGAQPVSVLAAPFDMALPSFMKHIGVLERSGLIRTSKLGRTRTCELVPARLSEAEQWIAAQRAMWEARADRMVAFVENLHQQETTDDANRSRSRKR